MRRTLRRRVSIRHPRQITNLSRQGIGHGFEPCLVIGRDGFPCGPEQAVAGVLDFSGDDLAGDGGAFGGIIGGTELSPTQRYAGVGHAGQPRLQIAKLREIVYCHTVFPTEIQRRRAQGTRPEYADGFQVMDGDGQLLGGDGRVPIPLRRRQFLGINGHLDLERQMIARHVGANSGQIKGVLLDVIQSGFW